MHKQGLGSKEKLKLTFLMLFDNPLSKYLSFKRNSCIQNLFWIFSRIKKVYGDSFWCTFSAWFFDKNVFYLILYERAKFQCHIYSFPRYQTKCIMKFLFSQLMMSQTIRFMLGQHLKQWLTGRKRGEDGNTKTRISREQKAF